MGGSPWAHVLALGLAGAAMATRRLAKAAMMLERRMILVSALAPRELSAECRYENPPDPVGEFVTAANACLRRQREPVRLIADTHDVAEWQRSAGWARAQRAASAVRSTSGDANPQAPLNLGRQA